MHNIGVLTEDKMTTHAQQLLKNALGLPSKERADLVDHLLSSLDLPDERMDALWRKEVEDRVTAYRAGKIKTIPLREVLAKYKT